MKKVHAALILLIFIAGCMAPNQDNTYRKTRENILTQATPEQVGMSGERLQRIDNLVNEYIDNNWIPGGVALIARQGKIVYYKSFGFNEIESKDSMQTDDIFRIASMTKAITSVAVMMLYEEGKFLLDDPVFMYIPEFENPTVITEIDLDKETYSTKQAKNDITIRHLLTHTSGIGYGFINPEMRFFYEKEDIPDGFVVSDARLGDKIKLLAKQPLLHEPGEKWTYGLNTDVLGYLIEVLSGMSLEEFFHTQIFIPLGMTDSYFYLPDEKVDRLVTIYAEEEDGIHVSEELSYNYPFEGGKSYFSGGAGINTTALDYARFMQMLVNGGEYKNHRLLSRKTIDLMTTNQIGKLRIWGGTPFGLGFSLVSEDQKHLMLSSVGNYSWGGYFSTSYWLDPEEELIATFVTQIYPAIHGDIHQKFQVLTYQAIID